MILNESRDCEFSTPGQMNEATRAEVEENVEVGICHSIKRE